MMKLLKPLRDCLTIGDGVSYCFARCSAAFLGFPPLIAGSGYDLIVHKHFNPPEFATAFAAILTAACAGAALKRKEDSPE